jgi:hypothetical protein
MTTPFMGLTVPVPSTTQGIPSAPAGQDWATLITAIFSKIDSHNHTSGNGAMITSSSILISSDFSLNGNNINAVNSLRLNSQGSTLSGSSDVGSLYQVLGDLYYNNGGGTAVKITTGSVVNSSTTSNVNFLEQAVSSNITIAAAATFNLYSINTTAPRTITLPLANAVAAGRWYIFKDLTGNSATNPITILTAGSQLIDGSGTSAVFGSAYGAWQLESDGASVWKVSSANYGPNPTFGTTTTGSLQCNGSFASVGGATINGNISAGGSLSAGTYLNVNTSATIGTSLQVSGATSLLNTLNVNAANVQLYSTSYPVFVTPRVHSHQEHAVACLLNVPNANISIGPFVVAMTQASSQYSAYFRLPSLHDGATLSSLTINFQTLGYSGPSDYPATMPSVQIYRSDGNSMTTSATVYSGSTSNWYLTGSKTFVYTPTQYNVIDTTNFTYAIYLNSPVGSGAAKSMSIGNLSPFYTGITDLRFA